MIIIDGRTIPNFVDMFNDSATYAVDISRLDEKGGVKLCDD